MKNRGGLVLGRNTTLDMIKDYVVDIGIDYPFVILGGPGTGKSAVMARVADVAYKMAALKEIPG